MLHSDGKTLLDPKGSYIYHYGKGDRTSIETFFDVPKKYEFLKDLSKYEAWRFSNPSKFIRDVSSLLGDPYDFNDFEEILNKLTGEEKKKNTKIHMKYFNDLETCGDEIVKLFTLSSNLHPMSCEFKPSALYLTPQCGEHERHQEILEKFVEINKSYIYEE